MKTLLKIFLMIAVISLVAGCTKDNDYTPSQLNDNEIRKVTLPFEADFYTVKAEDGNDLPCNGSEKESTWLTAHQIGEGSGIHLDEFSVDLTYCYYTGADKPGKYIDANFVFIAENGDELYAIIREGLVTYFDEPDENGNIAVYNDLLEFTGGTGQFKGVSGEGYLDSYLASPGLRWQHSIDSSITF